MKARGLAWLLLLSSLWCSASAIYEDQAGTFDWYKQYVGQPQSVAFVPGKDKFYLTTNQNLLASLNTKTGSVAWRRKYTDQDPLQKVVVLKKPPLALAASKGGKYVRAWDTVEGGFRWEALVFEGPPPSGSVPDLAVVDLPASQGGQAVAVVAGDKLQLLSASKGDLLWSADLEVASEATHKLLLVDTEIITALAYTPGSSKLFVLTFSATDGSLQDQEQLVASAALAGHAAVSGSTVAILSQDLQQLCTATLPGAAELSCAALASLNQQLTAAAAGPGLRLQAAGTAGHFTLAAPGGGVALISAAANEQPQLIHWFADASAAAAAATSLSSDSSGESTAEPMLLLASSSSDGTSVSLQLVDAATASEVDSSTLPLPAAPYIQSGPPPKLVGAWLDTSKLLIKPGGSLQRTTAGGLLKRCQALLLWSDHQIVFVSNNTAQWTREEGLASGSSSVVVELPSVKGDKAAAGAAGGAAGGASGVSAAAGGSSSSRGGVWGLLADSSKFKRWVRLQVLSVLVQFKLNTQPEKEEFLDLRQELSDNNLPYRDGNGFRKLIVLLSSTGKLFGLHSGDGRVLWTSTAALGPPEGAAEGAGRRYLLEWRRFHDLTHAPQLAVLVAGPGARTAVLHVVNGHTGEQLQEQELPYRVDKVIPLHPPVHHGAADQFSFLLVEQAEPAAAAAGDPDAADAALPRVHLLPDVTATQQQLQQLAGNLFFWLLHSDGTQAGVGNGDGAAADGAVSTVLRGYNVRVRSSAGSREGAAQVPVELAWQAVLPGQLLQLAARSPSEPLHSYVKVLGDRSLKYKYVNPNTLFVATGTAGAGQGSKWTTSDASVTASVLNTVTGAVLHQQVHHGYAGPVHAVASEHWVVYSLRDVVNLRQQATVIELYDASPRDLSIEAILLGRTRHSSTLSSYTSMALEVLSQSFYLQHSITGLSVTQTLQGITTKQILASTITDQVFALDKRFLDPRRPLRAKVTPEEAEEQLMPYSDLIIFSTLNYPTQDKQVLNLRGVTAHPAVLESTTLLFCYGTDLFYTRLTPAQHFDSLQSDFSYGLLVVALIALVGGTWFAAYSSQQSLLKAKWQ